MGGPDDTTARFATALAQSATSHYSFKLFVAGASLRSRQAIVAVTLLCETYLAGRYTLEVIDVYQQPTPTAAEQIFATPTLVRVVPHPRRLVIGDLADSLRVIEHLELEGALGADHA